MSGFSSVKQEDKVPLSDKDQSQSATSARAGLIDALAGNPDPTGGADRWDGTDFLAWGTNQNKFKEYKNITISGSIYNTYLNNNKAKYGNQVSYGKLTYNIPASVFTDKNNFDKSGNFNYNTGAKSNLGLEATSAAGLSIFGKQKNKIHEY